LDLHNENSPYIIFDRRQNAYDRSSNLNDESSDRSYFGKKILNESNHGEYFGAPVSRQISYVQNAKEYKGKTLTKLDPENIIGFVKDFSDSIGSVGYCAQPIYAYMTSTVKHALCQTMTAHRHSIYSVVELVGLKTKEIFELL
jgi:hypothetical protein